MFNEDEDWNDEQADRILHKSALIHTQMANGSNVKPKAVGKKSLLRTLQTLGSVPDWGSDGRQQESDSETEVAPSHRKKKKKRRKRRKQGETTGEHGEKGEKGELDQTVKEEEPVPGKKENKIAALKIKNTKINNIDITKSTTVNANKAEDAERLSRQRWKNKMKNKKKCKNKYRQDKPEEEVNKVESVEKEEPNEKVKTELQGNKNRGEISQMPAKTKEKEHRPQKRKKTGENSDISSQTQTLKEVKHFEKDSTMSAAGGSKRKAEEPDDQHESPVKRPKAELREQSLKREKLRKMLKSPEKDKRGSPAELRDESAEVQDETAEIQDVAAAPREEEVRRDRSASLRHRMEQRLESARFRYINEVLYSTTSGEARRMFRQDPDAFWIYHRGYTGQVQRWPTNPVDEIISYIQHKPPSLVVADFGCGDCKIARSVKNQVHSFDLAAACDLVTVCDMASVPLADASVDIAVFCLSLMGTNLADFLAEASRVLKRGGILKIAEVASRFENVRSFIAALANLGFKLVSKGTENTHFCSFELVKTGEAPENIKKFGLQLKPCLYKKR